VSRFTPLDRLRRGAVVAVLLAMVPFAPARAQLGRMIKKAAQGAIQGAAQDKVQEKTQQPAAQRTTSARESLVPITSQSIDVLLAALAPSVQASQDFAARQARWEKEDAAFERHRACRDSTKKRLGPATPAQTPAVTQALKSYSLRYTTLMQRLAAVQQAGDSASMRAITDSAGIAGEQLENTLQPPLKACGAYVAQPTLSKPDASRLAPPNVPAGMTATQFGRLRERVAAWLLTDGTYAVGPDERSALEARRSDLAPLTPLFRGNALAWSYWSDLSR
jgi:hypothetical protein